MSDPNQQQQHPAMPKARPTYKVYDMLQRGKEPRKHDVITKFYPKDSNGRQPEPEIVTYSLYSERPCEMEMSHAMKFLVDPAFKVVSPAGARIMPVTKIDISKPITALADDEIVAKYEELSKESLFRRVKTLPGSEDLAENAKHSELVDFMVNWRQSLKGMTDGERTLAEKMAGSGMDAMTEGQLDTMFQRNRVAA